MGVAHQLGTQIAIALSTGRVIVRRLSHIKAYPTRADNEDHDKCSRFVISLQVSAGE